MTIRLAAAARNASTNGVVGLIDAGPAAGTIKIYTGSQPATGDTAASGTLLATVVLGDPAFAASSAGTATGADPAACPGSRPAPPVGSGSRTRPARTSSTAR